jgi:type IV pilus assembly protein PilA
LILTPGSGAVTNTALPNAPLIAGAPLVWGCGIALTTAFRYVPANCRNQL